MSRGGLFAAEDYPKVIPKIIVAKWTYQNTFIRTRFQCINNPSLALGSPCLLDHACTNAGGGCLSQHAWFLQGFSMCDLAFFSSLEPVVAWWDCHGWLLVHCSLKITTHTHSFTHFQKSGIDGKKIENVAPTGRRARSHIHSKWVKISPPTQKCQQNWRPF